MTTHVLCFADAACCFCNRHCLRFLACDCCLAEGESLAERTIVGFGEKQQRQDQLMVDTQKDLMWWIRASELDPVGARNSFSDREEQQNGLDSLLAAAGLVKEESWKMVRLGSSATTCTGKLLYRLAQKIVFRVVDYGDTKFMRNILEVLSMSSLVLDNIELQLTMQCIITDKPVPEIRTQSLPSLLATIGCIVKQCCEDPPRYPRPLGVGNPAHERWAFGKEVDVMRLAARYNLFASAAYTIRKWDSEEKGAQKICERIARDPCPYSGSPPGGPADGVKVLGIFPDKNESYHGSKREVTVTTPAAFVARDELYGGALVLAIRGTQSIADVLTDALAIPLKIRGNGMLHGYAHAGIIHAQLGILYQVEGRLLAFVEEQLAAHKAGGTPKKLIITGHSLGGACAVCLVFNLLNAQPTIREMAKLGLLKVLCPGAPLWPRVPARRYPPTHACQPCSISVYAGVAPNSVQGPDRRPRTAWPGLVWWAWRGDCRLQL